MAGDDATSSVARSKDAVLEAIANPVKRASLERRMAAKVARGSPEECWNWTARATCCGGYGAINAGRGPKLRAHRVAWALAGGTLPGGAVICHRCDNPKCCNPAHMFLGTQAENAADMREKGRGVSPPTHWGERHHKATIPDADIPKILADPRSHATVAKDYGVSMNTIWRIRRGQSRVNPRD